MAFTLRPPSPPPEIDPLPLDHPLLVRAREILPASVRPYAWVAGSAAARYTRAWAGGGDVDIWIAGIGDLAWIHEQMKPEDRYQGEQPEEGDPNYPNARFVHASDRLHIMCDDDDISGILARFDITCHAAAVTLDAVTGTRYAFYDYTADGRRITTHSSYNQVVDVIYATEPRKTLKRVMKFAERYGDTGIWERDSIKRVAGRAFGGVIVDEVTASRMVPEGL